MNLTQDYISSLKKVLDNLPQESITKAIEMLHTARLNGRQVFIMGNGGSASTASHFVCDLAKNTRMEGWPYLKVIGLTDNMASFSAYANDEGYERVFSEQLRALVQSGDVVIAISASGNSPNVLEATDLANRMGATTIGFTGFDGGRLAPISSLSVHVPSSCIEQVEDIHLVLEHLICTALRQMTREPSPMNP